MKTSGKIWDIKTSEKIEALVCNPEGAVCFGSGGPEGDNAIMTEAIAEVKFMEKRVEELEHIRCAHEKALRECHRCHTHPTVCANRVDMFFHQLFPSEYNPHKALEAKG